MMKLISPRVLKFSFWIIIFIVFWFSGANYTDPDFYWHLKMGEVISEYGILSTDPFSYTMPSYPFVDHEWLTNLLIYKAYPLIGEIGLAAIAAALVLTSILLTLPGRLTFWMVVPILLSLGVLYRYFGVRPQIESWFLAALLIKTVTISDWWDRFKFYLPLLLVLWVNLHGSFAIGIVVLLLAFLATSWQDKEIKRDYLLVLLFSILATLINPYGPRIWWEVWQQFSDGSLRWAIIEWVPALLRINPPFLILLSLSLAYLVKYRHRFSHLQLLLFLAFLIAGLSSQRHLPFWALATLPLIILSQSLLLDEVKNNRIGYGRLMFLNRLFIPFSLILFIAIIISYYRINKDLNSNIFYPETATDYLKTQQLDGNIFNYYGWGGYLIWNLPEKKVYIDGRMPSWRWEPLSAKESRWAFQDYIKATTKPGVFLSEAEKYQINYVIWPTFLTPPVRVNFKTVIYRKINSLFGYSPENGNADYFIQRLQLSGWERIYEDSVAVIYRKPQ